VGASGARGARTRSDRPDLGRTPSLALDALLATRNVTQAAERVGITQSAMSHALRRLRAVTGDSLLVRAQGGMVTTPRADALGPPIRRALEEVALALAPTAKFDPQTARLAFTFMTTDYCELVLLPKLIALLAREAPGIDLRVVAQSDEVARPLAAGVFDLAIMPPHRSDESSSVFAQKLFDDRFVCVVRKGHPLAGKKLTLARFAAASHVLVSPRGATQSFVDDALAGLGLQRRIALVVPHFLIAPHVIATSDWIVTLAARVAELFAEPLGLTLLAPPPELRLSGFSVSAMWHERTQNDPAQRYLRAKLMAVAKGV
jgi:DNA-binding transcriptional LysR family regulator